MKKDIYVFFLVKGTWSNRFDKIFPPYGGSKNDQWEVFKDKISTKIENLPHTELIFIDCDENKEYRWTQNNRQADRDDGAEKFQEFVSQYLKSLSKPDLSLHTYYVSHSHGFEIVSGDASQNSELPDGIIAFNAPHIISIKRDFFANLDVNLWIILILSSLLFVSALISGFYSAFYSEQCDENSNVFESFVSQFGDITAFSIISGLFVSSTALLILKQRKNENSRDKSTSRKNKLQDKINSQNSRCPVFAINSSGDEAWNVLSFLSTLSQLPFFLLHKLFLAFLFLCVFVRNLVGSFFTFQAMQTDSMVQQYTFRFEWFGGFLDKNLFQFPDYFELAKYPERSTCAKATSLQDFTGYLSSFFISLSGTILMVGLICSSAMLCGYVLNFIYERVALGKNIVGRSLNFFETRQIVGMTPFKYKKVVFLDTGIGSSFLNHSAPYSDPDVCEVISELIFEDGLK